MKTEYRREMEGLGPRQEELDRLYAVLEGGTGMKGKRWVGRRAAAAVLVCAVLTATAAAASAPAVWNALAARLGVFAPYAQTIQGAVSADQGIELRVLSALSDDLKCRVYLSVQDVEGDRLDQCLTLTGRLTAGAETEGEAPVLSVGGAGTGQFKLLSYDTESKTALLSASIYYGDSAQPTRDARLSITGMSTRAGMLYGGAPCTAVTARTLDSLPAEGEVIFRIGDMADTAYTDEVLPREAVVLAPEQTPMALEGTEDMWVSSMGFASDGCFHVRLGLAEGVRPEERGFFADLFQRGDWDERLYTCQETLVEGGLDILFPLLHREDLEQIQGCEARFYGPYARPGVQVEGSWSAEFQLDYHPSVTLDWTGRTAAGQVYQVTLSPLSVTMRSNAPGGMDSVTLYVVKQDGSAVAAEPGTGRYSNLESRGGEGWDAFNTWEFQEPVELEELVSLTLGETVIPVR